MFLDFGSGGTHSSVVGRRYGVHEIIFIANSATGNNTHIEAFFETPREYGAWNYPEWSNHPDFAVAVATPTTPGGTSALYLIRCSDSAYLKIGEGSNIVDPSLWINPAVISEQDDPYRDFGKYDIPVRSNFQLEITSKLKLFWTRRKSIECAFIGFSTMYYGINPHAISHCTALSLACRGMEQQLSMIVARDYVFHHSPDLKIVVLHLGPGWMDVDPYPVDPFLSGFGDSKGYEFDSTNNFWADGVPPAIEEKIEAFRETQWLNHDTAGSYLPRTSGSWGKPLIEGTDYALTDTFVAMNLSLLREFASLCASKEIHALVVFFPHNPAYKNTSMIGRFGPSRETYEELDVWLRELEKSNTWFHFYDANNYGNHDYTDDDAIDPNHLGYRGQQKLSARVDSVIQEILF